MSFFRRIFSSDYRQALAAEAEGEFVAAARCYALCGEHQKVAQMHLAQSRLETDRAQRIQSLRNALRFCRENDSLQATVLQLLGETLIEQAEALGCETRSGREALEEAALLLEQATLWERAGDCYLLLGDQAQAAAALGKAGLLERVDDLLSALEATQNRQRTETSHFKDYHFFFQGGQRDQALEALGCCVASAQRQGDYQRLLAELKQRLITCGRVTLCCNDQPLTLVGRSPIWLGRDIDCDLRLVSPGISRRHAVIEVKGEAEAGGQFWVNDAGSHNGTLLNGLALGGPIPLKQSGTISLGSVASIDFTIRLIPSAAIRLQVAEGLGEKKILYAGPSAFDLAQLPEAGLPAVLYFNQGRPMLRCDKQGQRLNGEAIRGPIQLIRQDLVEIEHHRIKVLE